MGFDGYGLHTPLDEMTEGIAREGMKRRFFVDLDIEFVTPAWDMHTAGTHATGKGGMDDQGWAKEHYEQLYHATGTVQFGESTLPFDGYGWRDHSSGPRGGGTGAPWGGHVIIGTPLPGERARMGPRPLLDARRHDLARRVDGWSATTASSCTPRW